MRRMCASTQPMISQLSGSVLFQSQVRYHVLPVTYNWFSWIPYFIPSGGRVMVMHGRNPWLFKTRPRV